MICIVLIVDSSISKSEQTFNVNTVYNCCTIFVSYLVKYVLQTYFFLAKNILPSSPGRRPNTVSSAKYRS